MATSKTIEKESDHFELHECLDSRMSHGDSAARGVIQVRSGLYVHLASHRLDIERIKYTRTDF
jgi:hypothetical protein